MAEPTIVKTQRVFFTLTGSIFVIAALVLAQKLLIPLALAVLFTFILSPLVVGLQRRGFARPLAVGVVVLITFLIIGGVVWGVTEQLRSLAAELPEKKQTIIAKIEALKGTGSGPIANVMKMVQEIGDEIAPSRNNENVTDERIVVAATEKSPLMGYFTVLAMPILEGLANASFVMVLIVFMLSMREDLRGRLLRLIGHGRITTTTKALDDVGQRISRFLLTQSLINVIFGALFSAGLMVIGVPYALLWGFLAVLMRFIPYLGTWVALALPLIFFFAVSPGWLGPILLAAWFIALEMLAANVIEPVFLGHSTGISPVALLVAAAFWAWVWGPIGLILSTPLTTCLVALGKHISSLEFLDVLLGSTPPLATDITFYQRLLARDQDEAIEVIDDYLKDHAPETLFDQVMLPALVFAKSDFDRGELAEADLEFIKGAVKELLEDYTGLTESTPAETAAAASASEGGTCKVMVLGCPARDDTDELGLKMFQNLLGAAGCTLEIASAKMLTAEMVTRVRSEHLALVCIASLPPGGIAQTRYLCKRLRAHLPELKIVVGRWGQHDNMEKIKERLLAAGADFVANTLLESRDHILPLVQVAASQAEQKIEKVSDNRPVRLPVPI